MIDTLLISRTVISTAFLFSAACTAILTTPGGLNGNTTPPCKTYLFTTTYYSTFMVKVPSGGASSYQIMPFPLYRPCQLPKQPGHFFRPLPPAGIILSSWSG